MDRRVLLWLVSQHRSSRRGRLEGQARHIVRTGRSQIHSCRADSRRVSCMRIAIPGTEGHRRSHRTVLDKLLGMAMQVIALVDSRTSNQATTPHIKIRSRTSLQEPKDIKVMTGSTTTTADQTITGSTASRPYRLTKRTITDMSSNHDMKTTMTDGHLNQDSS